MVLPAAVGVLQVSHASHSSATFSARVRALISHLTASSRARRQRWRSDPVARRRVNLLAAPSARSLMERSLCNETLSLPRHPTGVGLPWLGTQMTSTSMPSDRS